MFTCLEISAGPGQRANAKNRPDIAASHCAEHPVFEANQSLVDGREHQAVFDVPTADLGIDPGFEIELAQFGPQGLWPTV